MKEGFAVKKKRFSVEQIVAVLKQVILGFERNIFRQLLAVTCR